MNYAHSRLIADLKASADIIVEEGAGETYLGFCQKGTATTSEAKWSILQVLESTPGTAGNVITFKWADGQCAFNKVFTNYAAENYAFKNF